MKKVIALVLALVMVMFCLAGCGRQSVNEPEPIDEPEVTAEVETVDVIEDEEPAEPVAESIYTLRDETLIDNALCFVALHEIRETDESIDLFFDTENRSDASNIVLTIDNTAINNCNVSTGSVVESTYEEEGSAVISIKKAELEKLQLLPVAKLDFRICVLQLVGDDAAYLMDETFTIYPTGEAPMDEELAEPAIEAETVLIDNDICKYSIIGVSDDEYGNKQCKYFIKNNSDHELYFEWKNVTINGQDNTTYWIEVVEPSQSIYGNIMLDLPLSEDGEVTDAEVNSIGFDLIVKDESDWTMPNLIHEHLDYNA